ncbi:hypothetical protein AAGV33_13375 [Flavobacterium sp. FBOR7N2.3]|uniref:Beta-lactamase-inhibitor-like PepSY-like domain-containing protein n=1 Tax=Flavobacterium magnesitis TaxID=3138077 RepID=A0ABV4TMP0_9FLAO
MKKLILSAAIVLGSLTTMNAQAQEENAVPTEQTTPAEQAAPVDQTAPAEQATTAEEATSTTTAFTEIKTEEVPAAVTEALKKAFPEAELNKASINDKKEYKLEVKVGDKEGALYADESGNWIQNN